MSNFFSRLFDAVKSLFGGNKETPSIPHPHYYSSPNPGEGFEGYWQPNNIYLRAAGTGFDSALSRVVVELNRGAREAGLPYLFSVTTAPGENVIVSWDTSGKVQSGEAGRTPPDEMIGYTPAMPWAHKRVVVYIRKGVSGDALYTLLLHEIFTHGGGLEHSGDSRDVSHPKASVGKLSAADLATWVKASARRKRDGIEPM